MTLPMNDFKVTAMTGETTPMTDTDMEKAREISHRAYTNYCLPDEDGVHCLACYDLTQSIAAAIKAEREACAASADIMAEVGTIYRGDKAARDIAAAIRARGGK